MADHIAAARTNYFRVKDLEDALIERAEQTFGIKPATLAHY